MTDKQAIRVGRKIDAHHVRLLVDDVIDEARVLVREAVVVLAPDMRREQVVERGDLAPPRKPRGHLEPLGVLVEHRIDDVDEGLVTIEEAVSPGEQVSFEPAFTLMLAQHRVDHAAAGGQVFVAWTASLRPTDARSFRAARRGRWRRSRPVRRRGSCAGPGSTPRLRAGKGRARACRRRPWRRAWARRRQSHESPACADRAAAARHWHADSRPCDACRAGTSPQCPTSIGHVRRTALPAGNS